MLDILLHPIFLGILGGVFFAIINIIRVYRIDYVHVKDFFLPMLTGVCAGLGWFIPGQLAGIPGSILAAILPFTLTITPDKVKEVLKYIVAPLPQLLTNTPPPVSATRGVEVAVLSQLEYSEQIKRELDKMITLLKTVCRGAQYCENCAYHAVNLPTGCSILAAFGAFNQPSDITAAVEGVISKIWVEKFIPQFQRMIRDVEFANRFNTLKWRIVLGLTYGITASTITTVISYLVVYVPMLAQII